jgi:predicted porin
MALLTSSSLRPLFGGALLSFGLMSSGVVDAEGFPALKMLAPGFGPYTFDTPKEDAFKVYGTLDGYVDTYNSGSTSGTRFAGGGAWTNKVGLFFRKSLNDDLSLLGVVEEGFNFDGNALSHNSSWVDVGRLRLAALALESKTWGKLEVGKTYSMNAPAFVDPFLVVSKESPYSSLSLPVHAPGSYALDLRPKNSLAYTTPKWHGLSLGSILSFGVDDATSTGRMIRGEGMRVNYWSPTLVLLGGYNRYWSDPFETPDSSHFQVRNDYYFVTGMYDFGPLSASLTWQQQDVKAVGVPQLNVITAGAMMPVGTDLARAVLVSRQVQGSNNDAWGVMVGYDHFFTPQTAIYVRAGLVVNEPNAGQTLAAIPLGDRGDTPQDLAVGVYHHF